MIPGFSAAPMFMRKAGGPVVTGRVKFGKDIFNDNNYQLYTTDLEIYTNNTGYLIDVAVVSLPDVYALIGLPFPYGVVFGIHDSNDYFEYSYSSATLGSVTLGPPVFTPDIGRSCHSLTAGVVAGFVPDVWYDFSITV